MNPPIAQKKNSIFNNAFLLLIFFLSFYPFSLSAQSDPNFILDHRDLIINVNEVATHGEISLRGLTGNFPYQIMATISAIDSDAVIITGLADTLRWLGPNETAENGLPITQIWNPVLEYHEENHSIPADPNIYNQLPEPSFTEVRGTDPVPTSTMLVMDVSSSMVEEIDEAKAGVSVYVDLMRPVDRAGVVQFSGTVELVQSMTADTALLKQAILGATLKTWTALYDGILAAIDGIKTEMCRRSVIVYTDGKNTAGSATPQAVIDSARAYNLPIYTIALGNATEDSLLQQIADSTGGLFFKAATVEEMRIIYGKLSVLMQNYYVMAYASPDPYFNYTWRLVDVTVNLPYLNLVGNGIGRYFVGGTPINLNADLSANIASITDRVIVIDGDSINAVKPGESYEYQLIIKNLGPNLVDTVQIIHLLPDSVLFLSASVPPGFVSADSLIWEYTDIVPQRELNISVNVQLKTNIPYTLNDLISGLKVTANNDTNVVNNFDSDTVKVIPFRYDLSVIQEVETEITTVIDGNEVPAVLPGDTYLCYLTIINSGPDTAYNFEIWDFLPDYVTPSNFTMPVTSQISDSLMWQIDFLAVGDTIKIVFDITVEDSLPGYPFALTNVSELIALSDLKPDNNSDSTTVYAIKEPISLLTDLAITLNSVTDTRIYINQDSVNAVYTGDNFSYLINVTNLGVNPTDTVRVVQSLPDSVSFISASPQPKFSQNGSLKWEFYNFQPGAIQAISVNAKLSDTVPEQVTELISQADVFGANDSTLSNNSALDTVWVIFKAPQKNYDLSLRQIAITDTTIWFQGDSVKAVMQGDIYRYSLSITNSGPAIAYLITLWDLFPDSVTISGFNIQPSKQTPDSLLWIFDSLMVGDSIQITFNAEVADSLPITPFPLINQSGLIAQNDTLAENNFFVTTVYGIAKIPPEKPRATDLALSLVSITDTTVVVNQKTYNAVRPNEEFQYLISVKNNGPNSADSLKLFHQLPDSVLFLDATLPAQILNQDSLFWELSSIQPETELTITVSVQLSADVPTELRELITSASISAINDSTKDNNFAADTVRVLIPAFNSDISVLQSAATDSFAVVGNDTLRFARTDETYSYTITVANISLVAAQDVKVFDMLPDSIIASNFQPLPELITEDSLVWSLGVLLPQTKIDLHFDATVASEMPIGKNYLVNGVKVTSTNEDPARLSNNNSLSTVINLVKPPWDWQPYIEAKPEVVKEGDPITVRVQVTAPIELWDLWVYLANGQIDSTYGDNFVATNPLVPDVWKTVAPAYSETKLFTEAKKEEIIFELRTRNVFGELKTANATVTIESNDSLVNGEDLVFDRNPFIPDKDNELQIGFKLKSDSQVRLEIYDITGTKITNITEGHFNAGENTYIWNGLTDNGQKVGSGFYILTLRSDEYHAWKKLMIIR